MSASPKWIVSLLAALCVSLATLLAPDAQQRSEQRGSEGFLKVLMGDGRRLFANHFFTMADVYFHSGYYPSIFDQPEQPGQKAIAQTHSDAKKDDSHGDAHDHSAHQHDEHGRCVLTTHDDHAVHKHDENGHCVTGEPEFAHEEGMDFVKEPRDWVERFGRNFTITEHTHLEAGQQREMLPWLKVAAEMDPQMVQTYTVGAFWLRREKSQTGEARQFLLEGLRNNPNNEEILFELGSLYYDDMSDTNRARNVLTRAFQSWIARPVETKTNNEAISLFDKIVVKLAYIENASGNLELAIRYFELGKTVSPNPEALQGQIDDIRKKLANGSRSPDVK